MEQHNQEIGTRRDLVLYRLETAKNDLKSARALFAIEDYRGANNLSLIHICNIGGVILMVLMISSLLYFSLKKNKKA